MIVVALLAVRCELKAEWVKKPSLNTGDMATIYTPKKDTEVDVVRRGEWDGAWRLEMGESKTRVSLASG